MYVLVIVSALQWPSRRAFHRASVFEPPRGCFREPIEFPLDRRQGPFDRGIGG